eukprot:256566-Amorphochlora_amoeboformis.AAC.1
MGDTFDVKVPTFAAVNDRREWHKQILIVGNQFARGFIGPTLADCKVILDCYVRFSTDLTQMLVAQMSYLEKEAPALIIDDMLLETTKSDRKAPSSPSKSRSDAGLFQMEKEKANKNRETLALLHAGKAMYEENRIRESVAKNMTKKQRFSSMRPNLINRGLQAICKTPTHFSLTDIIPEYFDPAYHIGLRKTWSLLTLVTLRVGRRIGRGLLSGDRARRSDVLML